MICCWFLVVWGRFRWLAAFQWTGHRGSWPTVLTVPGSGGRNLSNRDSIAHYLSLSSSHLSDMTKILFERTQNHKASVHLSSIDQEFCT